MSSNAATIIVGTAGAGLTAGAGKFCKMSSLGVVTLASSATATDTIGVLLGSAAEDESVTIQTSGPMSGMLAGGVITPGTYVTTDASGDVVAATAADVILGQYLPDVEALGFVTVASGDQISNIDIAQVKRLLFV